jgi:acylphosphatase
VADGFAAEGLVTAERLTARVTGRVQGVGFRWWVQRRAAELGLVGWVMNAPDERSVELVAEGTPDAIAELERLLHVGPSGAFVEAVETERGSASGEFDRFGIVRP